MSPNEPMSPNVQLVFHGIAQLLKIKLLERELAELKARLASQEQGRAWGD